jgi:hypothetical protein
MLPEVKQIDTWEAFVSRIAQYRERSGGRGSSQRVDSTRGSHWIFRGVAGYGTLQTSLELACKSAGVSRAYTPEVEWQIVREFRRHYAGPDQERVESDLLYCLGLMRHYGAPTRLLDWTYSPYVAFFFALERFSPGRTPYRHSGYIWCLETDSCGERVRQIVGNTLIEERLDDLTRNSQSFEKLYMPKQRKKFVCPENPRHFHERHRIQQGVFLCPGDVAATFQQNLDQITSGTPAAKLVQLQIRMTRQERNRALSELARANVTRASLFPGLDGFAQSLNQRLPFFQMLARRRTGKRPAHTA